jgi:hypothetical protein
MPFSSVNYYPGDAPITPHLGLSLVGMDEVVAEDMILIDTAFGTIGGSIKVNGSVVNNPNFVNSASVIFSVIGSNVSATAPTAAAPGGSTGDIQYNNSGVFGGSAATITAAGSISIPTAQVFSWDNLFTTAYVVQATSSSENGTTFVLTPTVPIKTGNQALVYVQSLSSVTPTVLDNTLLNTYALISGPDFSPFDTAFHWLFSCNVITGTPTSVTVTTGNDFGMCTLSEISNQNVNPIDKVSFAAITPGSTFWTSNPVVTTSDNELLVVPGGTENNSTIFTAGSGFSIAIKNNDTVNGQACFVEFGSAPTIASYIATINLSSVQGGGIYLVAIKGSGATVDAPDLAVSKASANALAIGNGTPGDASGSLLVTNLTVSSATITSSIASTTYSAGNGVVTTPSYNFTAQPSNGIYSVGTNAIGIAANAALLQQIDFAFGTTIVSGGLLGFSNTGLASGRDASIQRIGAASFILGNGAINSFAGSLKLTGINNVGTYTDSTGAVGTSGQVLSSTITGTKWIAAGTPAWSALTGTLSNGQVIPYADTGISRLGAASLAVGNGTAGDTTGNLSFNKVIKYAGISTVVAGVPSLRATAVLTGQSAAITNSLLYAVPVGQAGFYRITFSATITTAGTTSVLGGTNGFQSIYTSIVDSVVKTSTPTTPVISSANTTGTEISGVVCAYAKASTNINYNFGYSSTGTAMVYALEAYVEYLG